MEFLIFKLLRAGKFKIGPSSPVYFSIFPIFPAKPEIRNISMQNLFTGQMSNIT